MSEFKRDGSMACAVPLGFADAELKVCPFCRAEKPLWEVKEEWKLMGKNYYFRCPVCDSVLKASQDDVTGLSFTTVSTQGKLKKRQGKDLRTVYVKIEKIGLSVKTPENCILLGEEMPLPQLFAYGKEKAGADEKQK